MGNSPTPPGLIERIMQMVDERFARFARSGFLRNATVTDGGITIRGGFLRLVEKLSGVVLFYVGPITPAFPDGTKQQGWIVRREDGTTALALYDPIPDPASPDGFKQFLALYDRAGNNIISDDTQSGQGIARPYVPFAFYRSRSEDWPVVTATDWTTVYRARGPKQQPRLWVETWGHSNTAGATGQVRVTVNGAEFATPGDTVNGTVRGFNFGPTAVDGGHMSTLVIEVQARVVSGSGGVQVGVGRVEGRQS